MNEYKREHFITPRSYKEATGEFYAYDEPGLWERKLWRWLLIAGCGVVALLLLGVI